MLVQIALILAVSLMLLAGLFENIPTQKFVKACACAALSYALFRLGFDMEAQGYLRREELMLVFFPAILIGFMAGAYLIQTGIPAAVIEVFNGKTGLEKR